MGGKAKDASYRARYHQVSDEYDASWDLAGMVQHQVEPVTAGETDVLGSENTLQQDDAAVDAGLAQFDGFFNAGNAEGFGIGQSLRDPHKPVPVGVCLDDGDDPAFGRGPPYQAEIMLQGPQVDMRPRRPAHPKSPPAKCPSEA